MDQFDQHAEAARLLAAAARALSEDVRKVRQACQGPSRSRKTRSLRQDLLQQICGCLQLVAVAYGTCQALKQHPQHDAKMAVAGKVAENGRRRRTSATKPARLGKLAGRTH